MNIHLLREFVVLAECLNFHAAAARLYMTPSTLSRHIEAFEKELGVALLFRTTSHVELTRAGRVLLAEAPDVLNRCDLVIEKCRSSMSDGILRVGGFLEHPRVASLATSVIARFREQNPGIRISATAHSACDYETLILGGTMDVMFSPRYGPCRASGVVFHDLFDLPIKVWVNQNHPLARQTEVSLKDLAHMTFQLWQHSGTYLRWTSFVQQMFTDHGCTFRQGSGIDDSLLLMENEYTLSMDFPPSEYYGSGNVMLDIEEDYFVTMGIVHKSIGSSPLVAPFLIEVLGASMEQATSRSGDVLSPLLQP